MKLTSKINYNTGLSIGMKTEIFYTAHSYNPILGAQGLNENKNNRSLLHEFYHTITIYSTYHKELLMVFHLLDPFKMN